MTVVSRTPSDAYSVTCLASPVHIRVITVHAIAADFHYSSSIRAEGTACLGPAVRPQRALWTSSRSWWCGE
jgi:hypothetical protein